MCKRIDIQGERHGQLIVVRRVGSDRQQSQIWECRCDCGARRRATTSEIRNGHVRACKTCSRAANDGKEIDPRRYELRTQALQRQVDRIDAEIGWPRRTVTGRPGETPTVEEVPA